ncbi:MAG: hypothetical protein [phage Lak_Megaphage_RVC_AP4_GC26]|uniref:Uncharacterized protein n=1 Tax=phage Lak_Megaphage_RVC_AP3_GC26 TaxID=3109225 RepID=A0ABZ0Z0E8_9CAUD|nr:MAG: hypothetical protein [phage Lak_Megaphage_RVC_AP3_GC26]WQJ52485.1 MAG: hypothetical protein [phage Lak_Megaphage_RVC_AP4_GC26]
MAEYNTSDIVNVAKNTVSKWEKPGGTTGMIVLGVVVGAIAINITPIMNFIAAACASTLSAIGMAAALFLVLYCLFDPRIRNIGSTIYFMIMRKIEGLLVDYDPISIVKRKIMQMNNKIQEITDNMGKLRGLIDKSEKRIQDKKKQCDHDFQLLNKYKEAGKAQDAAVYERQVTRLTEVIKNSETRLIQSKQWYEIMGKLKHQAELTVLDATNEVNERVEEWEMIKAQHKAFTSIVGIINGKDDQFSLFTRAMDHMADDISQKLGEMSFIIEETGGLMSKIDMDNLVMSDKANALLAQYNSGGLDAVLLGSFAKQPIEHTPAENVEFKEAEFTNLNTITNNRNNVQQTLGQPNWF